MTDPSDGAPTTPAGTTQPATTPAVARGFGALAGDDFSLADAVGGPRGVVETALPGIVFVAVYVATRDLVPSVVAAAGLAVLAVLVRLVQRTPPTQAFSGLLGVGVGVVWALVTGRAQDFYVGGLITNVAYGGVLLVSILVGWPIVGVLVSMLRGEPMTWRTDPALAGLKRRYVQATAVFVVLFAARLAVQVPLYLQGEDAVGWLGTARLVMGVPLFALALWLTWSLVGPRGRPARPGPPPTPPR